MLAIKQAGNKRRPAEEALRPSPGGPGLHQSGQVRCKPALNMRRNPGK
jgi:hypothetical protein